MARKPILQRISLEGGDAIKEQLLSLGKAGEAAFKQIQNAAVKADLSKFSASLNKVGSDLATVTRRFALLGASITTAVSGAGVAVLALAKSSGEAADQAGKNAEKTGLTVEAYGRLEHAAQMANVSSDQLVAGMNRLNKAIGEAAKTSDNASGTLDDTGVRVIRFGANTKKAADATKQAGTIFDRLGVKIKNTNGTLRSNEEIVRDLAAAFAKMPSSAQKSALAIELFGKAGTDLLPFLDQGKQGLIDLGAEAERLGIVFTQQQADIGDALGDSLDSMSKAAAGIRLQLGLIFAPGVTALAEGLRDIIIQNRDAFLQFGQAVNQRLLATLSDVLFALVGADAKVKNPWILTWRDAIIQFGRDFVAVVQNVVLPLFKAVHTAAEGVADAINGVFGSRLTGGQLLIGVALLQLLGVFKLLISSATLVFRAFSLIRTIIVAIFSEGVIAAATTFFTTIVEGATAFLGFIAGLVGWPALIVAGLIAAGAAIFIFWDDIVDAAQRAIAAVKEFFSADNLAKVFEGLLQAAEQAGALLVDVFKLAVQGVGVALAGIITIVAGFVAGVVGEIAKLAAQLLPSWDTIKTAGTQVWEAIKGSALRVWDEIVTVALGIGERLKPAWSAITDGAGRAWTFIKDTASQLWDGVVDIFLAARDPVFNAVSTVANAAFEAWTGASQSVVDAANKIAEAIGRAVEATNDVQGAQALADALVRPFTDAKARIDEIIAGIRNLVQTGFNALLGVVNTVAAQVQQAISRIISQLQQAAAQAERLRAAASGGGGGDTSSGFASGGYVTGPGGPTSDSILAWLSNTEYVVQAKAVRKYGVGFFNALNSGLIPLKALRGFKLGGFVDSLNRSMMIPRFADGGMATMQLAPASSGLPNMTSFDLIIDGRSFGPAYIPGTAAMELQTASLRGARVSAGRAPRRK